MTRLASCPYCGGEHPLGVRFCPKTGRALRRAGAAQGVSPWLLGCAGLAGIGLLALGIWVTLASALPAPQPVADLIGWIAPSPTRPRPTRTPRPSETATPTATASPSATTTPNPTATASASPLPTWTPLPRASATPAIAVATGDPTRAGSSAGNATSGTACSVQVSGRFAALWGRLSAELGCPRYAAARSIQDAEEAFQNGHMLWRGDTDAYYVVYDGGGALEGGWSAYGSKYNEGGLAQCTESAPAGLVKPRSGFGNVWCALGGAKAAIGWALDQEYGFGAGRGSVYVQDFERGVVFQDSEGVNRNLVYILYLNGRFVRTAP